MTSGTSGKAPISPEIISAVAAFEKGIQGCGPSPEEMRTVYRAALLSIGQPDNPVAARDFEIATRHGSVPVRLYSPPSAKAPPLLVYIHGGGFVVGDLDCMDVPLHRIARTSGCAILSVGYSLSPEAKFPVAIEQCEDVLRWSTSHRAELNVNDIVGLGGDSCGGNMTAHIAQRLKHDKSIDLRWQGMINPVLDLCGVLEERTESLRIYRDGPVLVRDVMLWFTDSYCRSEADRVEASPLLVKDLSGLPPAFIATAECDPLRDEGAEYGDRLREQGVPVEYRCYKGMVHNYMIYSPISSTAAQMLVDFANDARKHLVIRPEAEKLIADRNQMFEEAYNAGDASSLVAAYFVENGSLPVAYPPGAAPVRGREALASMYNVVMEKFPKVKLKTEQLATDTVSAFEVGRAFLSASDGSQLAARYVIHWVNCGDTWRAQADFFALDGWNN